MLVNEEDERISTENKKIIVVGTGYVGFPVAILLARAGYKVVGVDVDDSIVDGINSGYLHIAEEELEKRCLRFINAFKLHQKN